MKTERNQKPSENSEILLYFDRILCFPVKIPKLPSPDDFCVLNKLTDKSWLHFTKKFITAEFSPKSKSSEISEFERNFKFPLFLEMATANVLCPLCQLRDTPNIEQKLPSVTSDNLNDIKLPAPMGQDSDAICVRSSDKDRNHITKQCDPKDLCRKCAVDLQTVINSKKTTVYTERPQLMKTMKVVLYRHNIP